MQIRMFLDGNLDTNISQMMLKRMLKLDFHVCQIQGCAFFSQNTRVAHMTLLSLFLLNQKPCLIQLTDVFSHRAALFYEAGEHLTWGVEGRIVSRRVAPKRPRVDISTLAQQVANHLNTVLIVTRTCNNGGQIIVLSTFWLIAWIANNKPKRLFDFVKFFFSRPQTSTWTKADD